MSAGPSASRHPTLRRPHGHSRPAAARLGRVRLPGQVRREAEEDCFGLPEDLMDDYSQVPEPMFASSTQVTGTPGLPEMCMVFGYHWPADDLLWRADYDEEACTSG